ncbi:hypothetical protein CAMGR0001_1703 [Campylobacter gracilis RM3268]|uniref:Uncharacterized protein n=1 Tax=Campylobacter gracilis RM3268 TaxID=553220 RepID=C8PIP2_9BACT|nr:hypothetical protein CAMGR0001_1703 [Campylobacter gracilis RM3268]
MNFAALKFSLLAPYLPSTVPPLNLRDWTIRAADLRWIKF